MKALTEIKERLKDHLYVTKTNPNLKEYARARFDFIAHAPADIRRLLDALEIATNHLDLIIKDKGAIVNSQSLAEFTLAQIKKRLGGESNGQK